MRKKMIGLLKSNMDVLKAAGVSATATLRLADHLIANDVVPVVRCKDCKHLRIASFGERYCNRDKTVELGELEEDDFCSHGERRI